MTADLIAAIVVTAAFALIAAITAHSVRDNRRTTAWVRREMKLLRAEHGLREPDDRSH